MGPSNHSFKVSSKEVFRDIPCVINKAHVYSEQKTTDQVSERLASQAQYMIPQEHFIIGFCVSGLDISSGNNNP